jgi:hypothetical protein
LSHSVPDFFLAPRVPGPLALARPRSLRAKTPSAATEQGRSAVRPLAVRMTPRQRYPAAGRPLGDPQPPETWPLAPAGRFETPTLRLETLKPGSSCPVAGPVERFNREPRVVVKSAPRADGAITPERAGTERPDRRVETLAPTGRLMRGRGTARVRTPVCASSVARAGGSEGCARCAARATSLRARGAKENLHGVEKRARPHPATRGTGKESRHAVTKPQPSCEPAGQEGTA